MSHYRIYTIGSSVVVLLLYANRDTRGVPPNKFLLAPVTTNTVTKKNIFIKKTRTKRLSNI